MGEARFPPPHGQTGYRDGGTPVPEAPPLPELERPELPRGKRVVASRPDDPDVALAKAFTPPKARVIRVSRAGVVLLVLGVLLWIAFEFAMRMPRARHPVSSSPCVGQHC